MSDEKNNIVFISGEISGDCKYSHEIHGKKFYKIFVKTKRLSGNEDIIPVIFSGEILNKKEIKDRVEISGQYRSKFIYKDGKKHLFLYVFAMDIGFCEKEDENMIFCIGEICKKPVFRETPLGRYIADVMISVKRSCNKNDYIPCIIWGSKAEYISNFNTGVKVKLEGRLQNREYIKKLYDGTQEERTAYEVSVSRIDVVESEE